MKNEKQFFQKKILVLGMAKSGYTAAKLLVRLGARITLNDRSSLSQDPKAEELRKLGVTIIDEGHPLTLLDDPFDLIVKNPGIPYTNPLLQEAERRGIPIITEVEIAGIISDAPFIAITGSNGKTTTTMLIGEMMKHSHLKPIVAGNIGTVLCEEAAQATRENIIVAELSSFQLLGTYEFHPQVAVYLNLFEAHLDYHGSLEHYGESKARITQNQTEEDTLVLNADNPHVLKYTAASKAKKMPFSASGQNREGAYVQEGRIYYQGEWIIDQGKVNLPPSHIENVLAAICAAKQFGVSSEAIREVLGSFSGVRHRLQFVDNIDGRRFYNDSKATNILATQKALEGFNEPVVLLAGGLDRGNSFDALIPSLKNVKVILAFGETQSKIVEAAKKAGIKTILTVDNVEEAVPVAFEHSEQGDVILLSPACASWDQYKSFEERGDMFIKRVHMLK